MISHRYPQFGRLDICYWIGDGGRGIGPAEIDIFTAKGAVIGVRYYASLVCGGEGCRRIWERARRIVDGMTTKTESDPMGGGERHFRWSLLHSLICALDHGAPGTNPAEFIQLAYYKAIKRPNSPSCTSPSRSLTGGTVSGGKTGLVTDSNLVEVRSRVLLNDGIPNTIFS